MSHTDGKVLTEENGTPPNYKIHGKFTKAIENPNLTHVADSK